ncbi:hypothetical protein LTR35_009593 [Friedmanniomyces endolithicus]|uniref:Uncharacterized protein n=1 Tax=Friedmanniomyces endolithicus TaxID=329885 RepID=A0AAN6FQ32_9PEZI|nr:hypothetical protein LTR35_009593 [Friedmanniomyces endolithicus]KAK0301200.1 hypothetical protein LTS00_000349 [Friedmanniomyces endolithicus]KAK0321208.1 hypothetical protein LTR82_007660 [Friedmanniomyces endolithicus]KAK0983917.1 hypothetical protein LTR54_014209 [Friedmanniomyces endolithicus]
MDVANANVDLSNPAQILRAIQYLQKRAVKSGYYTFYFTHLVPQPINPQDIQQTCGMLVQAGEIVSHAGDMAHHGNSITNAAYALFHTASVDASINEYSQMTDLHMFGKSEMDRAKAEVARWA